MEALTSFQSLVLIALWAILKHMHWEMSDPYYKQFYRILTLLKTSAKHKTIEHKSLHEILDQL